MLRETLLDRALGRRRALWILLEEDSERRRGSRSRSGLAFLAALAAAPQIVATAFWIRESTRGVSG
jgi:hypothetical protein